METATKSYLKNPKRINAIKNQRKLLSYYSDPSKLVLRKASTGQRFNSWNPVNLFNREPMKLSDMDPGVDKVYQGRMLCLTIIEEPLTAEPSLRLLGEDEDGTLIVIRIYNIAKDQATCQKFGPGQKLKIINPYSGVKGTVIRVDDPSTVMVVGGKQNMCRYCGEENALKLCGGCKRVKYCSKECQAEDWKTLDHKMICGNWTNNFA